MKFNVIGGGKLGKNIAIALSQSSDVKLGAIYNKHLKKAQLAIEQVGSGEAISNLNDLPAADIVFITVPDDSISTVVAYLVNHAILAPNTIVVHCSGVLSSSILKPLHQCLIASFHPLKAFRQDVVDKTSFQHCHCVLEGDYKAIACLTSLFSPLGALLISIHPNHKTIYHAAAVMASNYLVTLANSAISLFKESGIDDALSHEITVNLMQSSLTNIMHAPTLSSALTGPLARGDRLTISEHLTALSNPLIKELYTAAALATLPLTHLNAEQQTSLRDLLGRI